MTEGLPVKESTHLLLAVDSILKTNNRIWQNGQQSSICHHTRQRLLGSKACLWVEHLTTNQRLPWTNSLLDIAKYNEILCTLKTLLEINSFGHFGSCGCCTFCSKFNSGKHSIILSEYTSFPLMNAPADEAMEQDPSYSHSIWINYKPPPSMQIVIHPEFITTWSVLLCFALSGLATLLHSLSLTTKHQ